MEKRKNYWKWYRIVYLLVCGLLGLFFGTRVSQTILYWNLIAEWQADPNRWYMLISGITLCIFATGSAALFLVFQNKFAKLICAINAGIVFWIWIEQLLLSQIPDRFGKIPFLFIGTIIYTGWTFFVFREEFVHEQVC